MTELYDVAIVGTGPAGSSAAFHAAKAGLDALVIEEHQKPGEPVHCGECLSRLAMRRLGLNLPDSVISTHVKGIRVIFPNGSSSVVNESGYVLEKHKFEQWLMAEAVTAGAELVTGARLTQLARTWNWKLTTSAGEFESKLIIDASGVAAVVSRLLGLNPRFDCVTGLQYELADIPQDGYIDFYLWPELAPNGYLWMIPKSDGRANVGLVTDVAPKAKPLLDEFVKRKGWTKKKVNKTFGGLIPASGPLSRTFADGALLVGDAAGFTSPLFEGGTQLSLISGKFAVEVATQAMKQNDFSEKMLSRYKNLWSAEFPDYPKIISGKHALYKFTDEELNTIGRLLPGDLSNSGILEKLTFGFGVLTTNHSLFGRGVIPAMRAFGYSRAKYYGW